MDLRPLYTAADLHPAFQLRFGWSAWPSQVFPHSPDETTQKKLAQAWERDGMRPLEFNCSEEDFQITFSTSVQVAPVLITGRAKGRLEHEWRTAENKRVRFSRKVALRTVGDCTRATVEAYILNQVASASFADPRFSGLMQRFTRRDPTVDLSQPINTNSGRYWYNLHLVLVTDERHVVVEEGRLSLISECSFQIARRNGYRISVLSVMPDHLHAALQGRIDHSPQVIALAFLNNLAFALGQQRIWSNNYYVGTFGEYSMRAVR